MSDNVLDLSIKSKDTSTSATATTSPTVTAEKVTKPVPAVIPFIPAETLKTSKKT
jgi:hypothetical protein